MFRVKVVLRMKDDELSCLTVGDYRVGGEWRGEDGEHKVHGEAPRAHVPGWRYGAARENHQGTFI